MRVDPAQIEQVLVNLVVNAADAMPAGGRDRRPTANADVDRRWTTCPTAATPSSRSQDSGPGIDESALEHLFEPFFTTKDVGGGVGLGLATAYGIVKQSGGTISVTTAAGAGSTFAVYLPDASASRADDEPAAGAGETIVVVESNPAVRDVLFEVLSDAGYRADHDGHSHGCDARSPSIWIVRSTSCSPSSTRRVLPHWRSRSVLRGR